MNDEEIRTLVRESIERHLGHPAPPPRCAVAGAPRALSSHARFLVPSGDEADGPCLIEPRVHCSHCGYCQSYGH